MANHNEKLTVYLNGMFAPYDGVRSVAELKEDLHADLQEKYNDLKADGYDDDVAFAKTLDSIGDIEQTMQDVANVTRKLERKVLANMNASNMPGSDFSGVVAHQGKFNVSALAGSDFSGAELKGSSFSGSDLSGVKFDGANLTDCKFRAAALDGASFRQATILRTLFTMSSMERAVFADVNFIESEFSLGELKTSTFINCTFNGVEFKRCDLRGIVFDGFTFTDVSFDKCALNDVSLQGATLKNVSFRLPFSITNKHHRAMATINFAGCTMDKLTYNVLKSLYADVSQVTVV